MKLPKIYEHFSYGQIFTIDEAREKLETTGNTLRKRLSELSGRNYIHPIRQGLYRVARPGEPSDRRRSCPFHVASKVTPGGYLAFRSALELHAGEIPAPGDQVFIVSGTKFNSFAFEDRLFFWCQNPDAEGVEVLRIQDGDVEAEVRVTTFEKTLVDCLKRTAHSPGLERLEELCVLVGRAPDVSMLMRLAADCQVAALFNRLGFFLERMAAKDPHSWPLDADVILECERRMSRKATEWPLEVTPSIATGSQGAHARGQWRILFPVVGSPSDTRRGTSSSVPSPVQVPGAPASTPRPLAKPSLGGHEGKESREEIPWFHA